MTKLHTYTYTYDITNGFNNFFINIPKVLLTEIESPSTFDNVDDYINKFQIQNHAFSFTRIDESLIIECINDLKNSSGLDKLTNKCNKYAKHQQKSTFI